MAMATANSILLHRHCCPSGLARKNVPEQQKLLTPTRAEYTAAAGHSMPAKGVFTPGTLPAFKFAFAPNRRYARKAKTGVRSALMPWTWDQQRPIEEEPSYIVMWPTAFGEVISAINALKQGTTVILNLNGVKGVEEQQRCVDFVAGGCHALDGHQEYLAECVFLFAPPEVKVAASSIRDAS